MVGTSLSGNITFMQSQVQTAISSKSQSEWKHWMVVYVRFLVMCCKNTSPSMIESCTERISGVLDDLLGPGGVELFMDGGDGDENDKSWKSHILGVDKRVFLKDEILPLMAKSQHLQRLYQEFNEQL